MLLVAGFAIVILLSNHAKDTHTPEGTGIVADESSYENTIANAYAFATDPLKRYEDGAALTPDDVDKLHQAVNAINEANYYKPKAVKPFMLSGMIYLALGDDQKAIEKLQQGIKNIGDDHTAENAMAAIIAHDQLSQCYFAQGDFQKAYMEARVASEASPANPAFLVDRAKAALQLKFNLEARQEVAAALKLDPTYKPAIFLGKYLAGPKGLKK